MGEGYKLVCHDECSINLETDKARVWALKGSKPIKYISGTKEKINVGGFYTEDNEFYYYDLGDKQNTISFIESVEKLKIEINTKIFLLLDKASFHTSKDAKAYLENSTNKRLSLNSYVKWGYNTTIQYTQSHINHSIGCNLSQRVTVDWDIDTNDAVELKNLYIQHSC